MARSCPGDSLYSRVDGCASAGDCGAIAVILSLTALLASTCSPLPLARTCPQPHTVMGGIGYFQADTQHPDRFLFLSIGQYGILAGEDQLWQATIRFE